MGRPTCCMCVAIAPASVVISILGVLAGGVFGVIYAKNIYEGNVFIPSNNALETAVPYGAMTCWMLLALISIFGCVACWLARPKLVAVYFWLLLAQYILDLGFLVAAIYVAMMGGRAQREECLAGLAGSGVNGLESLCDSTFTVVAIIFVSILSIYKLISTYTTYVIFKFRKHLRKEDAMKQTVKAQEEAMGYAPQRSWSKFDD